MRGAGGLRDYGRYKGLLHWDVSGIGVIFTQAAAADSRLNWR